MIDRVRARVKGRVTGRLRDGYQVFDGEGGGELKSLLHSGDTPHRIMDSILEELPG